MVFLQNVYLGHEIVEYFVLFRLRRQSMLLPIRVRWGARLRSLWQVTSHHQNTFQSSLWCTWFDLIFFWLLALSWEVEKLLNTFLPSPILLLLLLHLAKIVVAYFIIMMLLKDALKVVLRTAKLLFTLRWAVIIFVLFLGHSFWDNMRLIYFQVCLIALLFCRSTCLRLLLLPIIRWKWLWFVRLKYYSSLSIKGHLLVRLL